MLIESISLLVYLISLRYSFLYCPEIFEDSLGIWCKLLVVFLGIISIYSFYKLLFRWKVTTLSSDCIEEEYYCIFRKEPYKVKRIVSWKKVKTVTLRKLSRMKKALPCLIIVDFFNDKGHLDWCRIDTQGLYFFDFKGQEYDARVVDCLNEIKKKYSFKIKYD